jgi:hypothetical protein
MQAGQIGPAAVPSAAAVQCRWSIHSGACGFGYISEDQPAVSKLQERELLPLHRF